MALAEPIATSGVLALVRDGTTGIVVGVVPPPMIAVTRSSSIRRRATTSDLASFDSLSYGISRIGTPFDAATSVEPVGQQGDGLELALRPGGRRPG